jgi:hypothetical protein
MHVMYRLRAEQEKALKKGLETFPQLSEVSV